MTATSRPDYRTLVLGALPRNTIRLSLPRPPISGADSAELRLRQAQVADFIQHSEQKANLLDSRSTLITIWCPPMDEGRKRVIGIMAAILASLHMQTADDLFGTPQGSPRKDKLKDASIQWAERIMRRIDAVCGKSE